MKKICKSSWVPICDIIMQPFPEKKKCKKAKWLSEEALQIATNSCEKKRRKSKGEKEKYTYLNAEFQRTARRGKKAFLSDPCKEMEENNWTGKTRDLFKKKMGRPEHLTCFLRNLYGGQEAIVRTGHGTTDWFQIGKGVCQGCILSGSQFSSVQSLSHVWLFVTPWITARQASLSIINSQNLLKLMSIELVMPSSHLILCCPLPLLPPIPPSIRVFSNESALHIRWPKYWSFCFNIKPSNVHPGLISLRMDWFDLLAVQGTLKSLFQQHSSKASIFWCSAFFIVQFSHLYMTNGKTIALTKWTFVGEGMSLLFNMLSRLAIAFFPRSKCLLISRLQHHLLWFWSSPK